jgi:hypothetical protein
VTQGKTPITTTITHHPEHKEIPAQQIIECCTNSDASKKRLRSIYAFEKNPNLSLSILKPKIRIVNN